MPEGKKGRKRTRKEETSALGEKQGNTRAIESRGKEIRWKAAMVKEKKKGRRMKKGTKGKEGRKKVQQRDPEGEKL